MAQTNVVAKDEFPAPRKRPLVDPKAIKLQADGLCFHEWVIHLPEGATFQDLNDDPTMWVSVQSHRGTALVRGDRVNIYAWDESWLVEARVAASTDRGVVLGGIKKIDMKPRTEALPQDEKYRIIWTGDGYAVQRKTDGVRVSGVVGSVGLAETEMRNQYRVSA